MNRTVNRLEEAGYVERTAMPDDGRKVVVVPTDRAGAGGRDRARRDAWLAQRLTRSTPDERAVLARPPVMRELADS